MEGLGAAVNGGLRIDNPGNPGDRIAIVEGCLIESSQPGSVGVNVYNSARLSSFQDNVLDVDGLSVSAAMRGFGDVLGPSNTYEAPLRVRRGTISGADLVWTKPLASDASTQPIRPTGSLTVTDGSLTIEAGNRIEMPVNGQLATAGWQSTGPRASPSCSRLSAVQRIGTGFGSEDRAAPGCRV
jgi:hypothetical protein